MRGLYRNPARKEDYRNTRQEGKLHSGFPLFLTKLKVFVSSLFLMYVISTAQLVHVRLCDSVEYFAVYCIGRRPSASQFLQSGCLVIVTICLLI